MRVQNLFQRGMIAFLRSLLSLRVTDWRRWTEPHSADGLSATKREGRAGIPALHTPAGHTQLHKPDRRETTKQAKSGARPSHGLGEGDSFQPGDLKMLLGGGRIWTELEGNRSFVKQKWVGERGRLDTGNSLNQGLGQERVWSKLDWWCEGGEWPWRGWK